MTGDPDKEYGTNKPSPTRRVRERLKGDTVCLSTCQNPSHKHPSWLSHACATRKDSELEWLAKDHLETNPITIKPETVSHAAEQFSWVPLPYCSPPGCPFPIKSLALSAHVSPRTIHFWMLDKSPVSGPGRGTPSCNRFTYMQIFFFFFFFLILFLQYYAIQSWFSLGVWNVNSTEELCVQYKEDWLWMICKFRLHRGSVLCSALSTSYVWRKISHHLSHPSLSAWLPLALCLSLPLTLLLLLSHFSRVQLCVTP